jgi:hypothetical protein
MKYVTLAVALALNQVEAFYGTAHLLVSRRAEDLLHSQSSQAYNAVLNELAVLK